VDASVSTVSAYVQLMGRATRPQIKRLILFSQPRRCPLHRCPKIRYGVSTDLCQSHSAWKCRRRFLPAPTR
jgi:hypothetical protein